MSLYHGHTYILIGKKFSSGASVSDLATGGKEVVIQGDVYFDVPALLINEFKVLLAHLYVVLLLCYTYANCEICAYLSCVCVYVRLRSRVFSFRMMPVDCNRANRDGSVEVRSYRIRCRAEVGTV